MRLSYYFQLWHSLANQTVTIPCYTRFVPARADPTSWLHQSGMSTPQQLSGNLTHPSLCPHPPCLFNKPLHPLSALPVLSTLSTLVWNLCKLALPASVIWVLVYHWWVHLWVDKRDALWWTNGTKEDTIVRSPLRRPLLSLLLPDACLLSDRYCL